MNNKLLLIGGGGHCHSVIDSVISLNKYDDLAIIDTINVSYMGVSVIGEDDDLPRLYREGWKKAIITVGSVGDTRTRRYIYESLKSIGFDIQTIIDPTSVIGKDAILGEGIFVGKKAIINAGSQVGKCAIINTASIVEHDCRIGEFVHISPAAVVCGNVTIGNDSHIGAGSCIKQTVNIGEKTLIGAGSVVINDIPSKVIAFGNPCKVVR